MLTRGERPKRPSAWSASLTFGWRAMLKIKHVPEQLFDVTAFPIIMTLMFTYLFGGALAGSTGEYLQFFLPGIMVTSVVMITMYTGVGLNTDIEKGVFDRFRTLPVWRPAALVGMIFGDVLRYILAAPMIIVRRPDPRLPPRGRRDGRGRRHRPAGRLLVRVLLGLDDVRPVPALGEIGDGRQHAGAVPADLPEQRLRRPADDAGLAAGLRRGQPDQPPGRAGSAR